jgi:serine/threonine protein kinase
MENATPPEPQVDDLSAGDSRGPFRLREGELLFGRYRLVRELGRGGMGLVLRATDTELGIDIALKLVPDILIHDEHALRDLRQEVLRGMALTHPGIVRTHGLVRDRDMAAIVMEFVDGGTFHDLKRLHPGGCFDPAELEPWLQQLSPALDYAHFEIQLAHRDLKPRNLMYTRSGRIKVADFGISSNLGDSMTRSTAASPSSGTPYYMSPQQVMGERPSHLDDIHALGATLYELLTGKPPFYQGEIIHQVLEKQAPPMNVRRAELGVTGKNPIPETWEKVVAACLAKDPAARPASAGEIVRALSLTDSAAVEIRSARTKRGSGKSRQVAGWVTAAVLVSAGLGTWAWLNSRQDLSPQVPLAPFVATIPEALPPAVVGQEFGHRLEARGGAEPYAWEAAPDSLPPWLTLDPDGRLHGTPETVGTHELDLIATDSRKSVSRSKTLLRVDPAADVPPAPPVPAPDPLRVATPETLPSGTVGIPYRFHLMAEGGKTPYQWTLDSGSPPSGVTLRPDGGIEGTPDQPFSGGFVARVTDAAGASLVSAIAMSIQPAAKPGTGETPAPPAIRASKEQPFTNSLGMEFVPSGTPGVLFATCLTRVKDFRAFAVDASPDMSGMVVGIEKGGKPEYTRLPLSWEDPGYVQTAEHPVCAVSWTDAMKFCDWLTNRELADGSLPSGYRYRLPLDAEWRAALELPPGEDAGRFPWGKGSPPNYRCNLAGSEIGNGEIPAGWEFITGFRDSAPFPAPVRHFPANRLGIHDAYGNLWQFCMDSVDGDSSNRIVRGGSWLTWKAEELAIDAKFFRHISVRSVNTGFRCVLAPYRPDQP